MSDKNNYGKKGETLVVEYLTKAGYLIEQVNWRHQHKEIDIIAKKANILAIVEVKSRGNDFLVAGREAINNQKQKLLIAAANAYVERYNKHEEVRFDIAEVVFFQQTYKINYIEDAFYPRAK